MAIKLDARSKEKTPANSNRGFKAVGPSVVEVLGSKLQGLGHHLCMRRSMASNKLLTEAAKATSIRVMDMMTSTLCSPMAFISM